MYTYRRTLISQIEEHVELADDEWRDAGQPATPGDLAIIYLYQASEIMRASGHMCTHMQITRAMSDIIKNSPQDTLMPATLGLPHKALSKQNENCARHFPAEIDNVKNTIRILRSF